MSEEPRLFRMTYKHCDTVWQDDWSCACDSECPVCGAAIEPSEVEDIEDMAPPEK